MVLKLLLHSSFPMLLMVFPKLEKVFPKLEKMCPKLEKMCPKLEKMRPKFQFFLVRPDLQAQKRPKKKPVGIFEDN